MGFNEEEKTKLFNNDLLIHSNRFTKNILGSTWRKYDFGNNIDTLFRSSLDTRLINDYLVKIDRSSMKNSLEIRSPF